MTEAGTATGERVRVFVRGLTVAVEIGVHDREKGRSQPLVIDVDLLVDLGSGRALADTVDYQAIAAFAHEIAARGHIGLVETYARALAQACLAMPRVRRARVRVEKPLALAPEALAAGVEISLGEA